MESTYSNGNAQVVTLAKIRAASAEVKRIGAEMDSAMRRLRAELSTLLLVPVLDVETDSRKVVRIRCMWHPDALLLRRLGQLIQTHWPEATVEAWSDSGSSYAL